MLGAEVEIKDRPWWQPLLASIAGAATVAALWKSHRNLGGMIGLVLGRNAFGVVVKDRTWQEAGRNVGQHVIATVGSLSIPSHPVMGWFAGAIAGDVLIDGHGGGLLEQWVRAIEGKKPVPVQTLALTKGSEQ